MSGRAAIWGLAVVAAAVWACREKPAGTDATPAAAPAAREVTIRANDYAFEAPDTIEAGLTALHFVNEGSTVHQAQLVRIDSGRTVREAVAAAIASAKLPPWLVPAGGPTGTNPHGAVTETQELAPGNYLLLCFVDLPGHVLHTRRGMLHPLVVTAARRPDAAPPHPDITVTLRSYAFDLSAPLTAGPHTFRVAFTPGDAQPHEFVLLRLEPGKTMQDFRTFLAQAEAGTAKGPPPMHTVGGVSAIGPGVEAYFTADIAAGDYVLSCFVVDAGDGKPHFLHGMMQAIHVS